MDTAFHEGQLDFLINASGFFNNNEFFGTHVEGYTLIGDYIQPGLEYSFSNDFAMVGGFHMLRNHGLDKIKQIEPFVYIRYKVLENIFLNIGSFNKGANLKLPEPLYQFENQFTSLTGNGIYIQSTFKRWEASTWLDWLHFIEPGDFFQEEFIFGHSGRLELMGHQTTRLYLPVYVIFNHKGGQINENDDPVVTQSDLGSGLVFEKTLNSGFLKEFSLQGNAFIHNKAGSGTEGYAAYAYSQINSKYLYLGLGYYYGNNWHSIMGTPLFITEEGISDEGSQEPRFLIFKLGLNKGIIQNSNFNLRFEGYYDPLLNKLQYTYGIHIILNEKIRILKAKKQTESPGIN